MQERRVVAEYEIFDLGHLWALGRLLDRHGLPYGGHVHVDLVMGVPGGMPGTTAALAITRCIGCSMPICSKIAPMMPVD
jgi:uncharacterized protein (DUF849 family)